MTFCPCLTPLTICVWVPSLMPMFTWWATMLLPSMVHTLFLALLMSLIFILPTVSLAGVKRRALVGTLSTPDFCCV